ncbi:hypothetical protein [Tabrizicola sp.]|uniref:hypothetical protein n=1 Tax=Tabrizicola sp. TaxID=2005166 RepID=UPI0035B44CE5
MDTVTLIDLAILGLLACGIGYGYLVSRRLERLRSALVAFGPALDAFCKAVERSEKSVQDLRAESGRIEASGSRARLPTPDERTVLMNTLTDFIRRRRP